MHIDDIKTGSWLVVVSCPTVTVSNPSFFGTVTESKQKLTGLNTSALHVLAVSPPYIIAEPINLLRTGTKSEAKVPHMTMLDTREWDFAAATPSLVKLAESLKESKVS